MLLIPIVHVVKDLISNTKREDKFKTNGYKELHQDHTLKLYSLEIVLNKSFDLKKFFWRDGSRRRSNEKQDWNRKWSSVNLAQRLDLSVQTFEQKKFPWCSFLSSPPTMTKNCATCKKAFNVSNKNYVFVSCNLNKRLKLSCTGLSQVAVKGIKELAQLAMQLCNNFVSNNECD